MYVKTCYIILLFTYSILYRYHGNRKAMGGWPWRLCYYHEDIVWQIPALIGQVWEERLGWVDFSHLTSFAWAIINHGSVNSIFIWHSFVIKIINNKTRWLVYVKYTYIIYCLLLEYFKYMFSNGGSLILMALWILIHPCVERNSW